MSRFTELMRQISRGNESDEKLEAFLLELKEKTYRLFMLYLVNELYSALIFKEESEIDSKMEKYYQEICQIAETFFLREEKVDVLRGKAEELRLRLLTLSEFFDSYGTSYEIFHHALLRKHSLREISLPKDKDETAREILELIFSNQDNFLINYTIKQVLKALPVRYTRGKFLDLLRAALDQYLGGDRQAFGNFKYRIENFLFSFSKEGGDEGFSDFVDEFKNFEAIDYGSLSKEEAKQVNDRLLKAMDIAANAFDHCSVLLSAINPLYGVLSLAEEKNFSSSKEEIDFIQLVLPYFTSIEDFTLEVEEKFDGMISKFVERIESIQEEIFGIEDLLFQLEETKKEKLLLLGRMDEVKQLSNLILIMKYPYFKEEDRKYFNQIVEKEYLEEVKQKMSETFEALFQKYKLPVRRSIMAHILGEIPVFLKNRTEVMEYVRTALTTCDNEEELMSSLSAIYDLRREDA